MAKNTDSIQFVVYSAAPITADAAALWAAHIQSPIHFQGSMPGTPSFAQGALATEQVRLQVQSSGAPQPGLPTILSAPALGGRIDMFILPGPQTQMTSFPSIADRTAVIRFGVAAMKRIAAQVGAARIAIIVQLSDSATDTADACQKVAALVPGIPVPRGVEELFFQTASNRASTSSQTRSVLRYGRWFTAKRSMLFLAIPGAPAITGVPPSVSDESTASEYLDVSTSPNLAALHDAEIDGLYDEMLLDIEELIKRGFAYLA